MTELISGMNLPAAQVMVAMGVPLHCIADIRRLYGQRDVAGTSRFELSNANRIPSVQHAVTCHIAAENPLNNFTPTSGLISSCTSARCPARVGYYFSLKTKSAIHDYADSQFGYIFASDATRDHAQNAMVLALSRLEIPSRSASCGTSV